jgi:hypothetical protein
MYVAKEHYSWESNGSIKYDERRITIFIVNYI